MLLRTIAFLTITLTLTGTDLFAEGKGPGAGRALSSAGRGAASANALGRAKPQPSLGSAPRAGASLGQANGLQRAGNAMSRGMSAKPTITPGDRVMDNHQRNLDHRLGQAEHLRSVQQRNGNEHLLETADRMEARANENYDRQTGIGSDATPLPRAKAVVADQRAKPKQGFWFRSR